nr:prepilin-type N-terminal cleavage/methylation domain-containing protein [Eggerthella sinensis]
MKEMIKRVREDRGGFTLAELLIVVAIIAVLAAVAVPVFTGAMDSSKLTVAQANIHAVKERAGAQYLLQKETGKVSYTAVVNSQGDITSFNKDTTTADATTTAESIKSKISEDDVTITVVVTADDVSGTAGGTTTP